jgi:hypothetical protein
MPEKAIRVPIQQVPKKTPCAHCGRPLHERKFVFVTSQGYYCSTTCKMWHEGMHERRA